MIDIRKEDGRAFKCTMCYDRLQVGLEPACAKTCPTESIQFGELDELRARADRRLKQLHEAGETGARLYGESPQDGVGGQGAFFLLLDEPEVYGLPPAPVVTTRDLPSMWRHAGYRSRDTAGRHRTCVRGQRQAPMSDSGVTREGVQNARPGREATPSRYFKKQRGEKSMVPRATFRSYYGRPILKQPTWEARDIAGYLFLGGLAGTSSALAAGAEFTGRPALARASKVGALGAISLSLAALVHDLGRPSRFVNMLRMFKPTSPMSVGSWLLAGYGPAVGVSAACAVTGRMRPLGRVATVGAGILGPAVASYTAVLIADTAVPAWHEPYRELPFVFAGSAASAGAGLALIAAPRNEVSPAQRVAVAASAAEFAATMRMSSRLGDVGETFEQGRAGTLLRAAEVLSIAGGIGAAFANRSRIVGSISGATLLAASACTRFGIFAAGRASVANPKYVINPQKLNAATDSYDGS